MKKHELLKYAYDNYPKGTKVKTLYDGEVAESSGIFVLSTNIWCNVGDLKKDFDIYDASSGKWAEIVKPNIAVKVENEKEFDALMKYYDSLGFSGMNAFSKFPENRVKMYGCLLITFQKDYIYPHPNFGTMDHLNPANYQIIPFSDFAQEHNIKLPLLKSEDGVWLYEGDKLFEVNKKWNSETWYLVDANNGEGFWIVGKEASKWKLSESDGYCSKAFSTKQAAVDWIEAQKPKEIKVNLFNKNIFARVSKKEISFFWKNGHIHSPSTLFHSDIEELTKAINELNKD